MSRSRRPSGATPEVVRFVLTVPADLLNRQIVEIFTAWGMPGGHADTAARIMVDTDLKGIDSHGIGMLPGYRNMRRDGKIVVDGEIRVVRELPSMALIDGGHGLGHPVAEKAMGLAIEKAKQSGIGVVSVRNSNHYGAAGYYAAMAPDEGLIGISLTGTPSSLVVPTFGKRTMFGTNPIAFAAPARRNPPFLLDMATSTVAIGKLAVAVRAGTDIPLGWAMDRDGRPTTDAPAAREARKLTPLGGSREMGSHKGYGLAAMVDILSSVLSGAAIFRVDEFTGRSQAAGNVGHFFLAADPAAVRGDDGFPDEMDDLIDALHATEPADPGQPVLVAGDPERAAYAERSKSGIPVTGRLADEIKDVARECNAPYLLEGSDS